MKPKVPPETDKAVHGQVAGSTGGPGENSAECACGVTFDGFDTYAEAIAELNEHIAAATAVEPRGYAVTTAELRRMADALDTLPPGDEPLFTHISLILGETTTEAVDAVAAAVGAGPGKTEPNGSGGWRHYAGVAAKAIRLGVQGKVPGPPDERDTEIEQLKAELAAARARGSE